MSRVFIVVWGGQLVSTLGSSMTGFALAIWVYRETGSVTRLAIVTLAATLPSLVLGPFAGALVDRVDRRVAMLAADTVAASATLTLAVIFATGRPPYSVIVLAAVVYGTTAAFQEPAYQAAIPALVAKEHLGRANGLVQLGPSLGSLLAPAGAGAILVVAGIEVVLLVDLVTFLFAVGTLITVRFPEIRDSVERVEPTSLWSDAREGFRYLGARRGLVGLLLIYAGANFFLDIANVLLTPLLLAVTNEAGLGTVVSLGGAASLLGGLVLSAWGGPRRKVRGIMTMIGIAAGGLVIAGWSPSIWAIGIGWASLVFLMPMIGGTSQTLWQTKVAPAVQGRVFAARRMVGSGISPLAFLAAGPLADLVFEPLMTPGGGLADTLGPVFGTGPGRGIGLLFVIAGLAIMLIAMVGWLVPRVRNLEAEIPDALPA
jgi:MFS family permease